MAGLNKCTFIGRLGKDPEIRTLDNGNKVSNFSLAVSEHYKDKTTGERKETTEWINCVAWKGIAQIAEKYLNKGDQVFVEGKLRTRTYEKDNITRYLTEVVVDNIQMLSQRNNKPGQEQQPNVSADSSTEDLPF